ncbi:integrase catalytic domain-containing protein [Trichonephila clavipes]|nr:integrase catalytic domain-containing protein [Trichonephila clavipes]
MNDGETSSRRHGVGLPHAIKEKGRQTLSCIAEQNRSQTVARLTAQYNAGPSRMEHGAEFQLMSWPANSSDINPIGYIWDVMGRQLRVQRPPI